MYETLAEIEALFGQAEESVSLDFKAGRSFDDMNAARGELVKDVTAFANAGGGTIIYGVGERQDGGRSVADDFAPVTNDRVTADQLTTIITSNTDPVFSGFSIQILALDSGGRIFVINVEQGDTAYQNRVDRRFYQRVAAVSEPMYNFAIRDVMNRRSAPRVNVAIGIERLQQAQDVHRYRVVPTLLNEGLLTAHHWCLHVDIPHAVGSLGQQARHIVYGPMAVRREGHEYHRFEYSSERSPGGETGLRILPGQTQLLSNQVGFPALDLQVNDAVWQQLERFEPSLHWTLYVDDAARKEGALPYQVWCNF
ncbi:AlbA family DNA-binding domain-containing protein [Ralstonia mannitolilytica]|uniref:AlbA family DNA-binding domain-containing protein n=1 Tax=Ralstonia mannitolilytica TaxID=105219 RepID=UPI0014259F92|nr:ATP-binding protein [Ralstonia mannitolilytica]